MKIQAAQYIVDEDGNNIGIKVTDENGEIRTAPVDGVTWVNAELQRWIEGGGTIAAAL